MTEPTRLLETPESELERALLDAGRSYAASSDLRTKTLLALGLSGVATSVAPSAAAATSSLTKGTVAKVAVALLVIGGAAVPAWRYFNRPRATPSVQRGAAIALAASAPAAPSEPVPAEPMAATAQSAPVEGPEIQAPAAVPSPSPARSGARPVATPPLAAELAALDAARASLSHSDPSAALAALDAYAHDFPRGKLKIEAEVLRIGALAKSGQSELARKRAETFLRRHPDSVLASRVRSSVGL